MHRGSSFCPKSRNSDSIRTTGWSILGVCRRNLVRKSKSPSLGIFPVSVYEQQPLSFHKASVPLFTSISRIRTASPFKSTPPTGPWQLSTSPTSYSSRWLVRRFGRIYRNRGRIWWWVRGHGTSVVRVWIVHSRKPSENPNHFRLLSSNRWT